MVMATWSAFSGGIWVKGRRVVAVVAANAGGLAAVSGLFCCVWMPWGTVLSKAPLVSACPTCHVIASRRMPWSP